MGGAKMNRVFQSFKKYQETEESYTDISISNMQNRVCDLLKEAQLKKVNLAKKTGMTKQQLNNFFNKGHNATLKTIGKIAHGLNKKIVISFVDKDVNNKDFYNYVQNYKLTLKNHKIALNTKLDFKNKLCESLLWNWAHLIKENKLYKISLSWDKYFDKYSIAENHPEESDYASIKTDREKTNTPIWNWTHLIKENKLYKISLSWDKYFDKYFIAENHPEESDYASIKTDREKTNTPNKPDSFWKGYQAS